jgi:hypothetical protein
MGYTARWDVTVSGHFPAMTAEEQFALMMPVVVEEIELGCIVEGRPFS